MQERGGVQRKINLYKVTLLDFQVDDVQINWLINDKSNDGTPNDINKREVCIIFLTKIVD